MKTLKTDLDYYNGHNEIPAGTFRISPSQLARFFTYTSQWYRENLLGETGFTSSTASVLGTCVHYVCEVYSKTQTFTDHNKQQIENYIIKHTTPGYSDFNPDVDGDLIRLQYKAMGNTVVNDFLSSHIPTNCEDFISHEILPGIHVGGSCDYYDAKTATVLDWKTTSALSAPKTISYEYRLQLLTYAWLYQQQGNPVNRIQIAYITRSQTGRVSDTTGKPLKDYPSTVTILSETISETDFDFIESILTLVAHSVQRWNSTPADRYLLAQDLRLKL